MLNLPFGKYRCSEWKPADAARSLHGSSFINIPTHRSVLWQTREFAGIFRIPTVGLTSDQRSWGLRLTIIPGGFWVLPKR
ncbi:MAG: hypothetical protein DWI00_10025 [Planctomycetota bacterium]|nr:MAG: hypothetical protein DWI00_10025 [Planctomycetota bacterium]